MLTHLLIMRHAKSSWDDPELGDHQRPLNRRGERAATAVGEALTARGYAPQTIWSSDSTRTRQTAMRLIRAIPGAQQVTFHPDMYHAPAEQMLNLARAQGEPDDVERLMWLGHNPGWAALHAHFTGRTHRFPTAACLVLARRTAQDWLAAESWRPLDLILPRELDA